MTVLDHRTQPVIAWVAVVERGLYPGDGRPAPYGPMHAARGASASTACGKPIGPSSGRRSLPAVPFSTIADAAATMVCGGCRRALLHEPDGLG